MNHATTSLTRTALQIVSANWRALVTRHLGSYCPHRENVGSNRHRLVARHCKTCLQVFRQGVLPGARAGAWESSGGDGHGATLVLAFDQRFLEKD